jgi:hypothetical protein
MAWSSLVRSSGGERSKVFANGCDFDALLRRCLQFEPAKRPNAETLDALAWRAEYVIHQERLT